MTSTTGFVVLNAEEPFTMMVVANTVADKSAGNSFATTAKAGMIMTVADPMHRSLKAGLSPVEVKRCRLSVPANRVEVL